MKHVAIRYLTHVTLTFTRPEIDILMKCSQNHYDGLCKSYSQDRPTDGYKWGPILTLSNIHRNISADESEVGGVERADAYLFELDFRRIDTMCKCLEIAGYLPSKEEKRLAGELSFKLSQVLKSINAHNLSDIPVGGEPLATAVWNENDTTWDIVIDGDVVAQCAKERRRDQVLALLNTRSVPQLS